LEEIIYPKETKSHPFSLCEREIMANVAEAERKMVSDEERETMSNENVRYLVEQLKSY